MKAIENTLIGSVGEYEGQRFPVPIHRYCRDLHIKVIAQIPARDRVEAFLGNRKYFKMV
jgi:hypothetical protein